MGQMVNRTSKERIPIKLSKDEIQTYVKRFQLIDKDKKGYVSINDIRRALKVRFKKIIKYLAIFSFKSIIHTLCINKIHISYCTELRRC